MIGPSSDIVIVTCEYWPFPGGIATYARGMAQALRAAGVSVMVIGPRYPDLPVEVDDPNISRSLSHHRIGLRSYIRLARLVRHLPNGSIVLAADIRSVLALYVLRTFAGGPRFRAMVHGSEASKFRNSSFLKHFVGSAYDAADTVVFNSAATRGIFETAFKVPRQGIVSYLGVESHWFDGDDSRFEHPELASIPESTIVVCSVGRVEDRKGQLEAVEVIARAREKHGLTSVLYIIAGRPESAEYAESVLRKARARNVSVLMLGRVCERDVKRLYARSACHLLLACARPGKIEGFGLVLLEAAAQGCASIATRVGGIPEVIEDAGILVDEFDLDAAADEVAHICTDRLHRNRIGAIARERAKQFTWEACAAATFPERSAHFESLTRGANVRVVGAV